MIAWLGRLAVRRVVWIVVGVAVWAALNAVGVRAVSTTYNVPGFTTANNRNTTITHGSTFEADGGNGLSWVATVTGGASSEFTLAIDCEGTTIATVARHSASSPTFLASSSWSASGTVPGTGLQTCVAYSYQYGSAVTVAGFVITYDDGTPAPTPTPTPTATPTPTPDPMCDPYCTVALSSEDRDRLDALLSDGLGTREVIAYGLGAVAFLVTAVAVTVGLRR